MALFESSGDTGGGRSIPSPDPLERLEAELGDQDGGRSSDERMYEEAQRLVEEAWGVLTECLGIRDGLLEACREVEEAMSGMQRRLGALSFAIDGEGPETAVGPEPALASSSAPAPSRPRDPTSGPAADIRDSFAS
jgi:hypothetical protein